MKTRAFVAVLILIALVLMASLVYAQGRARLGQGGGPGPGICPCGGAGFGPGAGYGRSGMPCPFGYTQPNPNAGGWWTRVKPTTKEQKAFVDEVTSLHEQIRQRQFELNNLRISKGDPKRIASLENELADLRTRLHDVMVKNRTLMTQMGVSSSAGAYCDPARCADCPYKDTCPCYTQGVCPCPDCPWCPCPKGGPPSGKPNPNAQQPTTPAK